MPPFSTLFSDSFLLPSILPHAEDECTCGRWNDLENPEKLEMCAVVSHVPRNEK